MTPTLKAPGYKRPKQKHDKLLSSFAFSSNLRRYTVVCHGEAQETQEHQLAGQRSVCYHVVLTAYGPSVPDWSKGILRGGVGGSHTGDWVHTELGGHVDTEAWAAS